MQTDFVPDLPLSGRDENIVTALDVFFHNLFVYPIFIQDTKTVVIVIMIILTMHAYLPKTFISDEGSTSVPHVIGEMAGVLVINLKHATRKHAQTIGMLERSHASIKQALKIKTDEQRSLWHKYVSIAVLNYNTSYLSRIRQFTPPTNHT